MPLPTYTGTTSMAHAVHAEYIDDFLRGYHYPPPVAVTVAASRPGLGNVPIRFPRLGAITVPAGTLAETVDAVDANVSTAEGTITPARVGFALPISDDLVEGLAAGEVPADVLAGAVNASWARIDSDLLATSTGSTATYGTVANDFTLAHLRGAKAAWRALNVAPGPLGIALVLAGDALSQLEESAASAGSPFALRPQDSPMFSLVHGYQGRLGDFELFSSSQVAAETTGFSNFITPIGAESGLGIVMSKPPSIVLHRGNDGERRATTYAHVSMRFGVGIIDQTAFLEVQSS